MLRAFVQIMDYKRFITGCVLTGFWWTIHFTPTLPYSHTPIPKLVSEQIKLVSEQIIFILRLSGEIKACNAECRGVGYSTQSQGAAELISGSRLEQEQNKRLELSLAEG